MARRTIKFSYGNVDYTLGFTLATIEQMERAGFIREEVGTKAASRMQELFYGSFIAEHKGIKRRLVDEIYKSLADKEGLLTALLELYDEAANALLDEGNVTWTMSE